MKEYDIIVIGAGVAGSVVARKIAEAGHSILLLEKAEYSGKTTACGGLFSKKYFEQLVEDNDILEQEVNKCEFIFPWGTMDNKDTFVTVQRCNLDLHLAKNAQKYGADLHNFAKAIDYEVVRPGEVLVKVFYTKSKEIIQYKCKICVFADGPFSLAKKNKLFDPKPVKKYWAFAYAYEIEGVTIDSDICKIYLDQNVIDWGYGWIFPNRNQLNIGVGTILPKMENREYLKKKLNDFINSNKESSKYLKNQPILRRNGGYIPMHLLECFYDDSQMVIGDAAGMVSPLFGAGIDYSIEAAFALSEVIDKAIKISDFSKNILKEYQERLENSIFKDLRKQILLAKIIIASLRFHKSLPTKILSIIAFGMDYTRWNKIRILFYPVLGMPRKKKTNKSLAFTHGIGD